MFYLARFSPRKWHLLAFTFIALAIIIMALNNQLVSADNQTYVVQMSTQEWHQLDATAVTQHSYDTFVWAELAAADFAKLQASGAKYQLQADPFTLTLGEQQFDPLRQTPTFTGNWGIAPAHGRKDLHLVQFSGPTRAEWLDSLISNGLEIVPPHDWDTGRGSGDSTASDGTESGSDRLGRER
jgi:hypothetical protein